MTMPERSTSTPQKQKSILSFFTKPSPSQVPSGSDPLSSITAVWKSDPSQENDEHDRDREHAPWTPHSNKWTPTSSAFSSLNIKSSSSPVTPLTSRKHAISMASSTLLVPVRPQGNHDKRDEDEDEDENETMPTPTKLRKRLNFIPSDDDHDHGFDHGAGAGSLQTAHQTEPCVGQARLLLDQFKSSPMSTLPSAPRSATASARTRTMSTRLPFDSDNEEEEEDNDNEEIAAALKSNGKNEDERYPWMISILDGDKRPPSHADYNPRTLYIPPAQWSKFTPFEKQFWEIKSAHFDTVVFFKKGKFYELYENDAEIGAREFDLRLTDRVNMKMAGVPESSFDLWASRFVTAGYKVAKVEQMENAVGKSIREKAEKGSKEDKIIRRELTCVLTAATLTDPGMLSDDMATYCLAIKETILADGKFQFGIAIVDTATSEFYLSCIAQDDKNYTFLETLLLQLRPKELLLEKNMIHVKTVKFLKTLLIKSSFTFLQSEKEFWTARKTTDEIDRMGYFAAVDEQTAGASNNWPTALAAAKSEPIILSAFGGLLYYLRSLKLDYGLLGFKKFSYYDPLKRAGALVLDGQTLVNLEIFQNGTDGTEQGTLFKFVNFCLTPFGKRCLKLWVCHPLRVKSDIEARLDAIDDFVQVEGFKEDVCTTLTKMPDLERALSRIHSGNCKIKEFIAVLDAFRAVASLFKRCHERLAFFKSALFLQMFQHLPCSIFSLISSFEESFDQRRATGEGQFVPRSGQDGDYEQLSENAKMIEAELGSHLTKMRKELRCSELKYRDINNTIYQLEMPSDCVAPKDWMLMSKTKALNRYWSPFIRESVRKLEEARELKTMYQAGYFGKVLSRFAASRSIWLSIVESLAALDCLYSLYICRRNIGGLACRPQFLEGLEEGSFHAEQLYHPCLLGSSRLNLIPNDVRLGQTNPSLMILTGPNMGGKSTLLRQTCLAIVLAQLGCYLPAKSCTMTLFDRLFTRIGAHDHIMAGQSTFLVELQEASRILREATPHSLVILDELGRGTSTFDGYAIAYAVVHYLSHYVGCLGLFSTHYRQLTTEFQCHPRVGLYHMNCAMDPEHRTVLFLYQLTEGVCPQSYGMNVAAMAGLPLSIIDRATTIAEQLESISKLSNAKVVSAPVAETKRHISVAELADLYYMLSVAPRSRHPLIVGRIIESFKRSTLA